MVFAILVSIFIIIVFVFSLYLKNPKVFHALEEEAVKRIPTFPFYAKRPLSKIEQSLYYQLVEVFPDKLILPQVALSRFLGVKKGNDNKYWMNRINRMTIDYLVCEKDFTIIAAIELDDASHDHPIQIERDEKKNKALRSANIKLIRWKVKNRPSKDRIFRDVTQEQEAELPEFLK